MKTIILYFKIHQPFKFRRFTFLEIGNGDYFDETLNTFSLKNKVLNSYLPFNRFLINLIDKHEKKLKINFCISGTTLEQFEKYTPDLIQSFQELAQTGCVEFIGETYAQSLAALTSHKEFAQQVTSHSRKIEELFGSKPKSFRIPQYLYTEELAYILEDLGFETVVLDDSDSKLEIGTSNFLHLDQISSNLKFLLNNTLIGNSSNYRLTEIIQGKLPNGKDKVVDLLNIPSVENKLIYLHIDYSALVNLKESSIGVNDFMENVIDKSFAMGAKFSHPFSLKSFRKKKKKSKTSIPLLIKKSKRNKINSHLGNDMQKEAFHSLYELEELVVNCPDPVIQQSWTHLQSSENFVYMSTSQIDSEGQFVNLSPYDSPFFAFINYMNILSDFRDRVQCLLEDIDKHSHIKEKCHYSHVYENN